MSLFLLQVYRNNKGKVAVNGMNLGMPKGECFGLLGVNGTISYTP